ncbi:hypothetical protein A2962_00920 [Candidatus Woesebacteria bacterium RIFCSPLOWO2_01_FULL_39_61]|uniref:ABC transmembrane type-1 domain-containing protein n=1 Tax=Candidatus Woesebacteria bacterium RIFCSPHIGHO2_02_FULL_39_13 TaxID=1802505 RepID=A0A1F7Z351_9BACT|nr:MAG: hypothetical protein A2692_00375 [Candidatus Woesebacteria bacterium RIFCSPHIGHO2_01_FULL_39_95]OGM33358.1 MAG: hypothetical protein A3D01_00425 [Candidatus Woesebacteria bacterium RIFCSPHIGHO2_02_FULL_39_13]OGM36274.1 MAG: hypothetical protein A3E13_03515 [Candidatus Woesebacteria bacterium RIFCSPHIGHO2_12_FULL_40_20]OGM68468.1 MAG: hypothetical protein A2962_00920 [Candidatus Woesebacteria bacterium RIFCSPLOWO2_01_FULL_39_61]OGM71308.1 MAG: hypothetical protein A3H19_02990 [Candidatus
MLQIIRRATSTLLMLVIFTMFVFLATEVLPGDAASHLLGSEATPENLAIERHKLGLDRPAYVRYFDWALNYLEGDMGTSYTWSYPIAPIVGRRIVNSILLTGMALLFSIPLAILLGVIAGKNHGRRLDNLISNVTLVAFSLPEFVTGIFLITLFSVTIRLFPATSSLAPDFTWTEWMKAAILPTLTLTFATIGYIVRLTRSSIINEMAKEYITTARAKGLREPTIVYRHALKNAIIPVIPAIGINAGWMFGGLVLTETVFAYPGIGSLFATAIANRDIPLIQAASIIVYFGYALTSILCDAIVIALNPKLRGAR